MRWREAMQKFFGHLPAGVLGNLMTQRAQDNDAAEALGFRCVLDDREGFGACYYENINAAVRVFCTARGWTRVSTHGKILTNERKVYHTLTDALADRNHYAITDASGEYMPASAAAAA